MVLKQKSILIISFFFPPYPKVGGRRWAKFAKYLKRNGHNVKVLCANYTVDKKSPWDDDVKEYESDVTRIMLEYKPAYYRRVSQTNSLFNKIKWHLSYRSDLLLKKIKKGDHLDSSIGYEDLFYSNAIKLVEKYAINNIIISGGPFRYCNKLSQLKKKYPSINFIFDMRDFWEDWMFDLTKSQHAYEKKLEFETLKNVDFLTTPAEKISERLKEKYPALAKKIMVLSHAFDKDDFTNLKNNYLPIAKKIRFVHSGVLYPKLEENMKLLVNLFKSFDEKNIEWTFDIYSFTKDYTEIFENARIMNKIRYFSPIDSKEILNKIKNEYDIVLYQRADISNDNHFMSTKFYEQLALRKPILYIGKEGDVSSFIINNNLGFHLNNNINELTTEIIENNTSSKIPNKNFDISNYSFDCITDQLEKILI